MACEIAALRWSYKKYLEKMENTFTVKLLRIYKAAESWKKDSTIS